MEVKPLNLYDNYALAAQKFADTAIILDEVLPAFPELSEQTTYEETHRLIVKRAYQMAQAGIEAGDFVMLYKSSKFDTYLLAVAVSYLGAIPVMVSYHLSSEVLDVFAQRLERSFLIYDDETTSRVKAMTEKVRGFHVNDLLVQQDFPTLQVRRELDAISYVTHTSGTTGIPKLICHSANRMGWRVLWQQRIFNHIEAKELLGFHISPVHSRFNIGVSSAMAMGFPLMPLSNATLDNVHRMFTQYPPIAVETHPNHFVQWSTLANQEPQVFHHTKYYHSTFDAINFGTMRVFLEASQKQDPIFLQVYGQSECGPMIVRSHTLNTLDKLNARNMGVGLSGLTQARITDTKGNVLPANTDGNIQLYSKGRALTYYKEDERFKANVYGEWWDSGDYGCLDCEGQLWLKDRQVDLVDNIDSNLAIEDFLLDGLPFLSEVVIVRGQDGRPQPVIAVHDAGEMDWQAWWQRIEDLPRLNKPIIISYEDIPRTATMKVQRRELETMIHHKDE